MPKIDAVKVIEVLRDALYRPPEIEDGKTPADAVLVEGIVNNFGFHPGRLESHREEVAGWLASLPSEFHAASGGGWTFLNACNDNEGHQWGEHRDMEALFCLGIGLGLVKCLLPREFWKALPGGMPYYVVLGPTI